MQSDSGELIPESYVFPLIAGVTVATVALTLYCLSNGISTVFMHLYYLPIILIAYFYRRRGIPVFIGLSLLYLTLATFFLYPSTIEIGTAGLRAGMFILIGVVVAELAERLQREKEGYRLAHEYEKSIIDNANVWLMVLDPSGRIVGWNRAAEQISGYLAEEVIGGNEVWKHIYPERIYRKEITGKIASIIQKDNYLENLQTTIVTKNGTKKAIVWNTRGLLDSEGTIRNYIAIGVDITDREKVAQISREYAEWYSSLLRTTHDGYNLVDATGRLIEVNDNYCRMTGFSREELLGRSISDQDANESKDVALAHMQRIFTTGSDRFETRHRTKDGGTIEVEVSVVLQVQKQQFIVFVRDITERKQSEMKLLESENKFHTMADFTSDWEYWQGQDKQIIYMSPSCHRITGYTQQEFLANPDLLEKIVYPDDLPTVQEHNHVAWETGKALSTDFRIINRDGSVRWIGHACRQVYDGQRNALGRRVSNRDITEQKIATLALSDSEEKFRAFFTTSRDCVFITSIDGHWIDFNNSAVELFGYPSREELMKVNIADLYAHPEERNAHLKIISEMGFSKEHPVDLKKKDGTIIHTLISSVARKDQNGTILGFQGVIRDVTEMKRAEMELQKLASVVRYSGEFVGIASLDGKATFLNDAGAQMLGMLPADAIGIDFFRFVPDYLKEKLRAEILPALMKSNIWSGELQYIHQKTGDLVDVHAMLFTIRDPVTGKPQYLANVSLDITARKRAEEALRTSQILLTEAMDLAQMAHWELDVLTGIFTFNDRFYTLYGTTAEREGGYQMPAEVYAKEFVHPDDLNIVADETNKAIAATDPNFTRQIEHRIVRRDGEVRHIIVRFGITKDAEGRTIKTHGANQDITERKRIEEALYNSQQILRSVLDTIPVRVFWKDRDLKYLGCNKPLAQDAGFNETEDLIGKDDYQMGWREQADLYRADDRHVIETGKPKLLIEEPQTTPDGRTIWLLTSKTPLHDSRGSISGVLGAYIDITERKKIEEALLLSENRYRTLSEASPDQIFIIGRDDTMQYVNSTALKLLRLSYDQVVGKPRKDFFPPELAKTQEVSLNKVFETGEHIHNEEKIQFGKNELWIDMNLVPLKDETGTVTSVLGIARDITERKRTEILIQESEYKFHTIFDATGDGMLLADAETYQFMMANAAIQKMVGYTEAELLKLTLSDIHPPADLPFVMEHFEKMVRGESDSTIEVPVLRKDGTIFYCDVSSSVTLTLQGRHYMLGIFHDITDRKRAEDALRQVNKQLNLLSSITRHDILNQLMALKGYLYLSKEMINDPATLAVYFQKEEQAANAIETQISFTRDYQELGVAAPEWQSVNESIEKALISLPMRAVHVETDPNNPEIFADRLFEKVFYNLIDNALRYGGTDMKTIRVSSQEIDTHLTIVCEDDGVGISADDKKKLFTRGFGKNTGLGLFLSREILGITRITITENGTPGKGARFEITIPKGMYRLG